MRPARALSSFIVLACLVLCSCNRKATPRLKVAATVFPIYDMTRRIAGPDAEVVLLVVPGRAETDIVPSAQEARAVTGVQLGIYVGLGLDDWMQQLLDQNAPQARRLAVGDRVPTIVYKANPVAQGVAHQGLPELDPRNAGKTDPYVWMDPHRAELIVKAIAEEMARADVAHASAYRSRAATLEREIESLDRDIEKRALGWWTHTFVPFRPAFGYLADRYHLDATVSVEPYAGRVPPIRYDQEVVRWIRAKGLGGVFREPQFPPKPASIVAEAARVPLGVLDALGGEPPVDSYEKLIRFDVDALEKVMHAEPKPNPLPEAGPPGLADIPLPASEAGSP